MERRLTALGCCAGFGLLLALLPLIAVADYVEVRRSANLYAEPNSNSAVLERFHPDTSSDPILFAVVESQRTNGYYAVETATGTRGWIYKTRVRHFAGDLPGEASAGTSTAAAGGLIGGAPIDSALGDSVTRLTNLAYTVAYSESKWNPLWVAHRVGPTHSGSCPRLKKFRFDARTQSGVTHNDYSNSGYDRGHMAPSATVGSEFGCEAQDETYFMSNITPQLPVLNQRPWGAFENLIEDSYAPRFNGVWVITGPVFDPDFLRELCSQVEVPIAFYKIVVRQAGGQPDALAVIMRQETAPNTPLRELVTTIDDIERQTHLNFFAALPDAAENALEAHVASSADWQLDTALDTNFRPDPRSTCLRPVVPRVAVPVDQ